MICTSLRPRKFIFFGHAINILCVAGILFTKCCGLSYKYFVLYFAVSKKLRIRKILLDVAALLNLKWKSISLLLRHVHVVWTLLYVQ